MDSTRKGKTVLDPVHGVIHLDHLAVKIIDTKYFQRLRNIKQLGFTDYVYPGATHTRFAHSIGVYHLACKIIQAIESECFPDGAYVMNEADKQCIRVAALCHDLGHGPFSHIYEHMANEILTKHERGGKDWKHEKMSAKLVEEMFQKKLRNELIENKLSLNLVKELIQGKNEKDMNENEKRKKYMFQIVSNADSGVDVDKWDYFNRDAMACGLLDGFQFDRFLSVARIVGTKDGAFELGYRDCDALNLYDMFHTRFILHQRIRHKVIIAVDIMMRDVFRFVHAANQDTNENSKAIDVFPVKCEGDHENPQAIEEYIRLSDDIIYKIRNHSGDKYKKAKELLQRIHERKLYKLVTDISIKVSESKDTNKLHQEYKRTKEEIQELVDQTQLTTPEDIEIQKVKFDYGRDGEDPVSKLHFYRKGSEDEGILLLKEDVSVVLPSIFQEYHIRVYEKVSQGSEKRNNQKMLQDFKKKLKEWEHSRTQHMLKIGQNQVETTENKCQSIVQGEISPLQEKRHLEQTDEVAGLSASKQVYVASEEVPEYDKLHISSI